MTHIQPRGILMMLIKVQPERRGVALADIKLLKERIADSGMTVKAICEKSGILRETFYNRLKGGEFTASEIVGLTKTLKLSRSDRDRIFLNEKLN